MRTRQVKTLVFSSSATVYGDPATVPLDETAPLWQPTPMRRPSLPASGSWPIWPRPTRPGALPRYGISSGGAHESGLIGEDPSGIPNNLMPFVARVASGRLPLLRVFGRDWPTPDGTGVRDYVHVVDLARGHIAALAALKRGPSGFTVNLGTGRGYSVLEVIAAFERASGRQVPYEFTEAVPAMWRSMPRPDWPAPCWAGRPVLILTACARMPGAGRAAIRRAIGPRSSAGTRAGRSSQALASASSGRAASAPRTIQQHALVLAAAVGVLAHQVLGAHRLAPGDGAQQVFVIGLGAQHERRFQQ